MNINDFKIEIPPGDKLETIFGHQRALMLKYHEVEQKNLGVDLPNPENIDLDDQRCQLRLKEFAWRITEELAEASEAIHNRIHMLEELVDALHFSVEFDLMCHLAPEQIIPASMSKTGEAMDLLEVVFMAFPPAPEATVGGQIDPIALSVLVWRAVEKLGTAMNCLKNKPWKTTHMVTDKSQFLDQVIQFNHSLFALLSNVGFSPETLTQVYLNKNAVNQFRIESNY